MINKPPPHSRDHNRDPDSKALKRWGFINQGFASMTHVYYGKVTGSNCSGLAVRSEALQSPKPSFPSLGSLQVFPLETLNPESSPPKP